MTTGLRVANRISQIAEFWKPLADELYALPNWLQTAEQRSAGACHYAVLRRDGSPVGALVGYETLPDSWFFTNPVALLTQSTSTLEPFLDETERSELLAAAGQLTQAQARLYPALVSVLPSGYLPGLLRGAGADGTVTEQLADELGRLADEHGYATTAVMHVREEDTDLRERLVGRGYLPFASVGDCVLHTPWDDFDDYLASLTSPRPNRIRREIRSFTESGAVLRETPLNALGEEHARLHALHMRRYGHEAEVAASRQLIANIQAHPTGRGRVLEARRGDELVGFVVFYELGQTFHPKMIGIAEGEKRAFTYFNLTYYGLIRIALAEGIRCIGYGPEAYEAKALRGCSLERRVNHVLVPREFRGPATRAAELVDRAYRRRMDRHDWARG
ncbi:GNAT family N-acetyltransferase [Streptomyces caelestis]|jgi:predicted N-acyltransferase|uniref:Putative N-acyltransferase n=1 Tax=Streptomyces caelestis TaxID=36816 RepID=A0A7W9GZI3_9ACTN|nr:GNAT family N-acetyltransferase [Streptomyces caelestis]MBB5792889.1 putative N-acyltransferase [Streptomyces caelestis]GGW75798.1 hypothetical protein GCM10010320_67190 [Streptomyces caelestis]